MQSNQMVFGFSDAVLTVRRAAGVLRYAAHRATTETRSGQIHGTTKRGVGYMAWLKWHAPLNHNEWRDEVFGPMLVAFGGGK